MLANLLEWRIHDAHEHSTILKSPTEKSTRHFAEESGAVEMAANAK